MIIAPYPKNETKRQKALERYGILDSLPERAYDDITRLMADVCEAPVSLVGLIDNDRNWLKSHHGVPLSESPRAISFCSHAIVSGQAVFTVENACNDPRFADNPLVDEHGVVSYAGAPLIDRDGYALGTLCVFNTQPMQLDPSQRDALASMARQVMYLLERHLRERRLERTGQDLARRNDQLERFVGAVTHDILGPVTNIAVHLDLIGEDVGEGEVRDDLLRIRRCALSLQAYIDGLLSHYLADDATELAPTIFTLGELFESVDEMVVRPSPITLVYPEEATEIRSHRAALQQVLLNLLANAIKYGASRVEVTFCQDGGHYRFSVIDDGPGIPPESHEPIFELFEKGAHVDPKDASGSGIGLATVSKLLERLGGTISVDSAVGCGSTFCFTLPVQEMEAMAA